MRRTKAWLLILLLSLSITSCSKSNNNEQPQNTSVTEEESFTPVPMLDNVTVDEYEDYSYAGYTGTMTYCYRDNAPYYHKWYTNFPKKKSANKAYKKICSEFESQYGTGEVANDKASAFYTTSWKTDTEEITVQNMKTDSSYEVSFTVTQK